MLELSIFAIMFCVFAAVGLIMLERRIEALENAIKQGQSASESSGPTTSGKVEGIEIPFELDIHFECKSDTGKDCFFCKEERGN